MATTINVSSTDASNPLRGPGGAWRAVVDGATTTATYVQAQDGELEWCEAPTASPPAASLVGHDIRKGEQMVLEALAASQSYYIRALNSGFTRAIVTPGTAAA